MSKLEQRWLIQESCITLDSNNQCAARVDWATCLQIIPWNLNEFIGRDVQRALNEVIRWSGRVVPCLVGHLGITNDSSKEERVTIDFGEQDGPILCCGSCERNVVVVRNVPVSNLSILGSQECWRVVDSSLAIVHWCKRHWVVEDAKVAEALNTLVDIAAKEPTIDRCSTIPTLLVDIFSHSLVHTDFLNVVDLDRFGGEVETCVIAQPHPLLCIKALRLVLHH